MDRVDYELRKSVEYSRGGDGMVQASFVSLSVPTAKHLEYTAPLRQAMTRAVVNQQRNAMQNDDKGGEDIELTGEILVKFLEANDPDFPKTVLHFQQFVVSTDLFLLDGEQRYTRPLWDRTSTDDVYGMLGAYLKSFA